MAETKLNLRVHAIQYEADGINSYDLRPVDGGELPAFAAGAHIDLHLPNRLVRSYSLCNSQSERDRYVTTIARDPNTRGGSLYMHATLRVGDALAVTAPTNNFPLVENASEVVLFGGGIGVTPLYCMAQRLEDLGRNWKIFYSSRTKKSCAFIKAFEAFEKKKPGRVNLNFDHDPGGKMYDLSQLVAGTAVDSHLYCCGPLPMLSAFVQACASRPKDHVHVEYFTAIEAPAAGGFTVVLARSGETFQIAEGKSILDTLLDAGVDVPFACMGGVCGTCEVGVLEGTPDHRDVVLTPEERDANNKIMICVSGSKTDKLVLDI
jgi:ferredoxin-NADP reductase